MLKFKPLVFLIIAFPCSCFAQQTEKPKLLIGIVIDQMRYDYLDRFYGDFEEGGFKKLLDEGYSFENVNYNYKPTYTGPGHASVFTGTSPSKHGIVANNWYEKSTKSMVYCVKEGPQEGEGIYSPKRMLVESIADAIRQSTAFKGKSYGISLKDRGAILPAGHTANGAFWFDSKDGKWTSSAYYEDEALKSLKNFNELDFRKKYLNEDWTAQFDEKDFRHDIDDWFEKEAWEVLKKVPNGNQMTADLAKELILVNELGRDNYLDFLSISFSATDYIGHKYGVYSPEVRSAYKELDRSLADLLLFLNQQLGKENYLLFLTSDHGAIPSRNYLKANNLPNGRFDMKAIKDRLESTLDEKLGEKDWIASLYNLNVYFNPEISIDNGVLELAKHTLLKMEGILDVYSMHQRDIAFGSYLKIVENGVQEHRSGELILLEKPGWTYYADQGSTHGSPYNYDTHVPLLFYGKSIQNGRSIKAYPITTIAATLSSLLNVAIPNAAETEVLIELFEKK